VPLLLVYETGFDCGGGACRPPDGRRRWRRAPEPPTASGQHSSEIATSQAVRFGGRTPPDDGVRPRRTLRAGGIATERASGRGIPVPSLLRSSASARSQRRTPSRHSSCHCGQSQSRVDRGRAGTNGEDTALARNVRATTEWSRTMAIETTKKFVSDRSMCVDSW
jgi:hypothetical protein